MKRKIKNSIDGRIKRLETKKVNKLGTGYIVFVSRECKELGWDNKTKVKVAIIENGFGEDQIVISKSD